MPKKSLTVFWKIFEVGICGGIYLTVITQLWYCNSKWLRKELFTCTLVYLALFFCSIKKENTCLQLRSNSGTTDRVTIHCMYCLGFALISSAIFNECPMSCLSTFLFPVHSWPRPEAQSLFLWFHRWGHRVYCSATKWWAPSFLWRGCILCNTSAKSKVENQVQLMWVDAECDQSFGAGSGVLELISGAKLSFMFPHFGGVVLQLFSISPQTWEWKS